MQYWDEVVVERLLRNHLFNISRKIFNSVSRQPTFKKMKKTNFTETHLS